MHIFISVDYYQENNSDVTNENQLVIDCRKIVKNLEKSRMADPDYNSKPISSSILHIDLDSDQKAQNFFIEAFSRIYNFILRGGLMSEISFVFDNNVQIPIYFAEKIRSTLSFLGYKAYYIQDELVKYA